MRPRAQRRACHSCRACRPNVTSCPLVSALLYLQESQGRRSGGVEREPGRGRVNDGAAAASRAQRHGVRAGQCRLSPCCRRRRHTDCSSFFPTTSFLTAPPPMRQPLSPCRSSCRRTLTCSTFSRWTQLAGCRCRVLPMCHPSSMNQGDKGCLRGGFCCCFKLWTCSDGAVRPCACSVVAGRLSRHHRAAQSRAPWCASSWVAAPCSSHASSRRRATPACSSGEQARGSAGHCCLRQLWPAQAGNCLQSARCMFPAGFLVATVPCCRTALTLHTAGPAQAGSNCASTLLAWQTWRPLASGRRGQWALWGDTLTLPAFGCVML